jgi:ABC-type transport system involved in multi-copper enzyme maturation permease subunit
MRLTALRWLVRDVFRQARAVGLSTTLAACTALAVLACLTVQFTPDSDGGDKGTLTTLFGLVTVLGGESLDTAARFLQFVLAGVVADTLGVLLALIWTAGFLPAAVDPAAASVLLAKPVGRGTALVGKFLGVVAYVAVQGAVFVTLTGLALGARTGVWSAGYWLCVPLLLAHFTVFLSVSALVAVSTRSPAGCVVGAIVAWLVCWGMNYGRHALVGLAPEEATATLVRAVEAMYWVLPKPADFGLILYDTLGADRFVTPWVEFRAVQAQGDFHPMLSVITSLAVAAALLGLAVYEFLHEDY